MAIPNAAKPQSPATTGGKGPPNKAMVSSMYSQETDFRCLCVKVLSPLQHVLRACRRGSFIVKVLYASRQVCKIVLKVPPCWKEYWKGRKGKSRSSLANMRSAQGNCAIHASPGSHGYIGDLTLCDEGFSEPSEMLSLGWKMQCVR